MNRIGVYPIPCLSDNYSYLILDQDTGAAAVVDPVEPQKVLAELKKHKVSLKNLRFALTTHHHGDHAGGNSELKELVGGDLQIVGGKLDNVEACTLPVNDGDVLELGSLQVRVIHTPCHTKGHVLYLVTRPASDGKGGKKQQEEQEGGGCVFTGDTLFVGGCGRFFEGTGDEMYNSLAKVHAFPDDTLVYCGHEYTVANLKFAAAVEPNNKDVTTKQAWAEEERRAGRPTVPSTVREEKLFNPFMRVDKRAVQAYAKKDKPVEVMDFIREAKNNFK